MNLIVLLLVYSVAVVVNTGVLAGALLLTGEEINKDSLGKSAAVVTFATIVSFIPMVGGVFALTAWFAGVMGFFEKSFPEALLVTIICAVAFFAIGAGLGEAG